MNDATGVGYCANILLKNWDRRYWCKALQSTRQTEKRDSCVFCDFMNEIKDGLGFNFIVFQFGRVKRKKFTCDQSIFSFHLKILHPWTLEFSHPVYTFFHGTNVAKILTTKIARFHRSFSHNLSSKGMRILHLVWHAKAWVYKEIRKIVPQNQI